MSAIDTSRPVLSDHQLVEMLGLVREADSVELKLTVPEAEQRSAVAALGMDPLDAPDPSGVLLRHPRPEPQPAGRRRPRAPGPGQGRRLGGEAAAGHPARAAVRAAPEPRVRGRGRRDAGRVRLLGVDEGRGAPGHACARRCRAAKRCASSSRRSSARSTPSTRPRASPSTTWRCSGRSSSSSSSSRRRATTASSSPSCGCIPTARGSSSCRRSARRRRRSRSRPRRARSWPSAASSLSGEQQTKTRTALEFFSAELA